MKQDNRIQLTNVSKMFAAESGSVTVLKDISLSIEQGEYVTVHGKSGSGKSTMLNMLTGIDRPTRGEVIMAGTQVHTLNESDMATWRGNNVGIVFQFFQLLPGLSVADNVMLPMDFCNTVVKSQRRKRAMELLQRVGLASHANKLPSNLSGGEQQRVAIARALANDPPFLVADEPTGNLDIETTASINSLFTQLNREGKTVIIVTHEMHEDVPYTRVITLSDGHIVKNERQSATTPDA